MNTKSNNKIKFNDKVKLIISDVDETIADVYKKADSRMIGELDKLLSEGKVIFMISGHSAKGIHERILAGSNPENRKRILIGHCSGVEVFGYDDEGNLNEQPFYSLYNEKLDENQKSKLRQIVEQVVEEFSLIVYPTSEVEEFVIKSEGNPLAIMLDDRGPQITFEVINGHDLSKDQAEQLPFKITEGEHGWDIRDVLKLRFEQLLQEAQIPVDPRKAGVFALDLAVSGVSKTTAVKYVIENNELLNRLGLEPKILKDPSSVEVWGDKFSEKRGGTDRHISEGLPKDVRSVDFRQEDPSEFPEGYNIVVWSGERHLHDGLLEYLESRHDG